MYTNYLELLECPLKANEESIKDLVFKNLTDREMSRDFLNDYACSEEIKPFRAWSANFVYFSTEYDGRVGVASVPRSPSIDPVRHICH